MKIKYTINQKENLLQASFLGFEIRIGKHDAEDDYSGFWLEAWHKDDRQNQILDVNIASSDAAKKLAEKYIQKKINRRVKKLESELSTFKSEGFNGIQNAHTGVANIIFNWKITGENNGANQSSVEAFGHNARIFKSYDNHLWSIIIDNRGTRGIESEASAKLFAESEIKKRIQARVDKAQSDSDLFARYNVVATPKPSGQYLSLADFKAYIENNLKPALEVVGTNLRNPNKLNQAAARALGFSSYEALQPLHYREEMIREKLYVERCPYQDNAVTIKAGNIIVVFDEDANKIRFRALKPGQECERVTDDNEFTAVDYGDIPMDMNVPLTEYRFTDAGEHDLLAPQIDVVFCDPYNAENAFVIKRTYEGIIMDMIYDYKTSAGSMDTRAVAFEDAECENIDAVDQTNVTLNNPAPALDGDFYQWLMPTMTEDGLRYLLINEKEEVCLSKIMFATPQEAIEAINEENWGAGPETVEEAVLVQVTKKVVGNGHTLCPSDIDN